MQWELRRELHAALRIGTGSNFLEYGHAMRKKDHWNFNDALPEVVGLSVDEQLFRRRVDGCSVAFRLPEQTREWFIRHYHAILQHAHCVAEHGPWVHQHADWMFGEITNATQHGRIRVLCGPQSLHFRCESKEDCARLIYPNESDPLQEENRGIIRSARGVYSTKKMVRGMGDHYLSISAENYEVTKGLDAYGTFEHEQEHAANASMAHASTVIGPSETDESGLERCVRLGVSDMVREELIAWSLRKKTNFTGLFFGANAPYKPVDSAVRILRRNNVGEQDIRTFTTHATNYLELIGPEAITAMQSLMARYPHSIIREVLRTTPLQDWSDIAAELTTKR